MAQWQIKAKIPVSRILVWFVMLLPVVLGTGCASLPPQQGRVESHAVTDTGDTRLGKALAPAITANLGKSGVHNLGDPLDAFAARVLLARAAEKAIDAQYYIWHDDQSGELLLEALWDAAERGVHVRLLVDDVGTRDFDAKHAALMTHPNIEVRIYNPFAKRGGHASGFLTDFTRVNRRMHNKSFTVDNEASVVGGRNIGNEYFTLGHGLGFFDADVLVGGPIVQDISDCFDLYWNSPSAYPADRLIKPVPGAVDALKAGFAAAHADPDSKDYIEALRTTPLVTDLVEKRLHLEWTTMQFIHDDPAKTLDTSGRTDVLLYPALITAMQDPKENLDIISPYFVPSEAMVTRLGEIARSGVRVRILTNSLSSSDAASVHAGYKKHREKLAAAGVQLWELKPTAGLRPTGKTPIGSSSSSLHAKVYAKDNNRIFVGSYNFDQRSAHLNTEQGLVIDSAALAGFLATRLDQGLPTQAYQVKMAADGHSLQWIEHTDTGEVTYDVDPGTSWWLRAEVSMLSVMPIDWLL